METAGATESATALMLLGTAYARAGAREPALAHLSDARRRAPADDVALRSEIALGEVLAHYLQSDFDAAQAALEGVDPGSDVVFARGLGFLGWIAKSRNDFTACVAAFEASLAHFDQCAQRDDAIEANIIMALSNISVELLDFARFDRSSNARSVLDWTTPSMRYNRFWLETNRSVAAELRGRPREALQAARDAADAAPSDAFRLQAQCRRAAVLFSRMANCSASRTRRRRFAVSSI